MRISCFGCSKVVVLTEQYQQALSEADLAQGVCFILHTVNGFIDFGNYL